MFLWDEIIKNVHLEGLNPAAGYSSALSNGYSAAAAGYPGYGGQAGYGCLAPYPTGVVPSSFSSMSAAAYTGQVATNSPMFSV